MNTTIALVLRNIGRNRVRMAIALSAIAFGVAALLVAGGFIEWIFYAIRESYIKSLAGHIQIVLSSHLLRDVEECCDEVLVLKNGEVAVACDLEAERRANRRFLELELRGDHVAFTAAAEGLGCEAATTTTGGKLRVKLVLPEGLEVGELFRAAHQGGVQIRHLAHRRDSLEDIFLKAMEG